MSNHFDIDHPSPFMLETCQVKSSLDLPAITHVDNSARVHSVNSSDSPKYAALIREFEKLTGCPILLNTSFNMRGEPIVCTPIDAVSCFVKSGIDFLVIEDFIIDRGSIPPFWPDVFSIHKEITHGKVSHTVYTFF